MYKLYIIVWYIYYNVFIVLFDTENDSNFGSFSVLSRSSFNKEPSSMETTNK